MLSESTFRSTSHQPDHSPTPFPILDGFQRPGQAPATHPCDYCERGFSAYSYLALHQRTCKPTKRGLSSLLGDTKQFWETRKRRKTANTEGIFTENPYHPRLNSPNGNTIATTANTRRAVTQARIARVNEPAAPDQMDLDLPIAHRKAKRRPQHRSSTQTQGTNAQPGPMPIVIEGSVVLVADEPCIEDPDRGGHRRATELVPRPVQPARILVVRSSGRNAFQVSRAYRIPLGTTITHNPDAKVRLPVPTQDGARAGPSKPGRGDGHQYGPFTNKSAFDLAEWYWGSTQKSFSDFEKLVHILREPDFSLPDTLRVNWRAAFKALGANREDLSEQEGQWIQDDGWKSTPVSIEVPFHKQQQNSGIQAYLVGNFRHRSILSVIKEKISSAKDSQQFHYQPYRATWQPDAGSPDLELYGELYASRAFREVNEEIQSLPSTPRNEGLERVVVSLMFWSDGTRLTSFGGSSLWPCYMFFGNESKYRRCRPSEHLGQQIAYFLKLPDTFKDYLKNRNGGKVPTDALLSHCARELFQCQWCVLLDDELVEAMKDGIVLLCPDGKLRCFYPRIFTYSADYPEKILIAGVRNNGGCPCHRCLIKKADLSNLGSPDDTERRDKTRSEEGQSRKVAEAREVIRAGYAVTTDQIENLLKPVSLVPTVTSLSTRLSDLNFKVLPALVVDLLHEFEIGVWKNLFIHLIRLLDAFTQRDGPTLTAELDTRYRATPAFGRDTIRKFSANASEMKRKAARDYEDLLQCAIPAFEGLLPEPHNSHLMRLLYICAQWHALAKLRLHHDLTLDLLDYTTVRLGAQMRLFDRDTCQNTATRELPKEAEARARREGSGKGKGSASRKPRKLSVFTIKFHVLGDYSTIIRQYGTTDSYSTETGELCHRLPKAWFERTDKRDYEVQLSAIERRQARLSSIREATGGSDSGEDRSPPNPISKASVDSDTLNHSADSQYSIGLTQNNPLDLLQFASDPTIPYLDPYLKNTIPKLKQHLLPRILAHLGYRSAEEVRKCDWTSVVLQGNRLFSHKLMRINFTTYDARLEQDVIHIDTPQCNVMSLNRLQGSSHPYRYGRVFGIFHAIVSYIGQLPDGSIRYTPHRIDFCWVHWYEFNKSNDEFGLERVSPRPFDSPQALNFLDPADILRAVHLIPQFSLKLMHTGLPPKTKWGSKQPLWNTYFINRFADRDLFMRYQYRMSLGHKYMYSDQANFPPLSPRRIIPDNFDYCMAAPEVNGSESRSTDAAPIAGPSAKPHPHQTPMAEVSSSGGWRPENRLLPWPPSEPIPHQALATKGLLSTGVAAPSPWGVGTSLNPHFSSLAEGSRGHHQWGHLREEEPQQQQQQEEEEEEEEEEEAAEGEVIPSYFDDFDDDELVTHDDMYGSQMDTYF